ECFDVAIAGGGSQMIEGLGVPALGVAPLRLPERVRSPLSGIRIHVASVSFAFVSAQLPTLPLVPGAVVLARGGACRRRPAGGREHGRPGPVRDRLSRASR